MAMSNLAGKVAIVTGASSGIGRALAMSLAREGCKVVLAGRSRDRLRALENELGDSSLAYPLDLASGAEITGMVERTVAHFGGLDILIANAGLFMTGAFADADPDEWSRLIAVNIDGVFRCAHAVLPHMRARKSGDILVMSSIAGVSEMRNEPIYSASKHAVQAFVHSLRRQVSEDNIRVGAIQPGTVATELWGPVDPAAVAARVAERTVLTPEDVAAAAIFVLSQPPNVTIRDLVILPQRQDI
jgi:ribitol 2-dehydrogenase